MYKKIITLFISFLYLFLLGSCPMPNDDPIPPSLIFISAERLQLNPGQSAQLHVTAFPSNAAVSSLWMSSSPDVTVFNGVVTVAESAVPGDEITLTAMSTLDFTKMDTCTIEVRDDTVPSSWTFIYYCDSDNNLEEYLLNDIYEMKEGLRQDLDINSDHNIDFNVIALVDRIYGYSENASILGENFTGTRMYLINSGGTARLDGEDIFPDISLSRESELNMGDAHTLKNFITYCKTRYPADNYALCFSNHGGGARTAKNQTPPDAVKAVCWDDSNGGDCLYTAEVTDVLTSSESVDLIIYDACLMGAVEVAYQYRPGTGDFSADYMLASAPVVWGYGLNYRDSFSRISPASGNNSQTDQTLSQTYEEYVSPAVLTPETLAAIFLEDQRDSLPPEYTSDQSFSVFDLSAMDNVKTAVDAWAVVLDGDKTRLENLRGGIDDYTSVMEYFLENYDEEWIMYPLFDIYDLAERFSHVSGINSNAKTNAQAVMSAVDNAVLYSFGNSDYRAYGTGSFKEGKSGLSIFFPEGDQEYTTNQGTYSHWALQWWYNAEETNWAAGQYYGKLAWCADGAVPGNNTVENWFELLDSWYDLPGNNAGGGGNGYQW